MKDMMEAGGRFDYFNRSEPIGVEQVNPFLADIEIEGKLSLADRSYVLAAGCFLEARGGGGVEGFEKGKFLAILKDEFSTNPRSAMAVATDLIVYIAASPEWRFDDVFGEAAVGNHEVMALWNTLANGCDVALGRYVGEQAVLEKALLGSAIGSFANNLEQQMMVEGETEEADAEIGPRVVWAPKDSGERLGEWLEDLEIRKLAGEAVRDLVGEVDRLRTDMRAE